jgi:hypothetical protein
LFPKTMAFCPFYGICFLFFSWTSHCISYLKVLPDSIIFNYTFYWKKLFQKNFLTLLLRFVNQNVKWFLIMFSHKSKQMESK